MSDVRVFSPDMAKFKKDLTSFPKKAQVYLGQQLFAAGSIVKLDAATNAPSGVSRRASKLKPNLVVIKKSWQEVEVGARDTVKHAAVVEFGSKGHFPPVQALTGKEEELDRWVRIKLGVSRKQTMGVALAIARKIAKNGTKAQPFMLPALQRNEAAVERLILQGVDKAIKTLL